MDFIEAFIRIAEKVVIASRNVAVGQVGSKLTFIGSLPSISFVKGLPDSTSSKD